MIPLYETPYFLVSKGRYGEALCNLKKMVEYNGGHIADDDMLGFAHKMAAESQIREQVKSQEAKAGIIKGIGHELAGGWKIAREMWTENIAKDKVLRRTTLTVMVFWFFAKYVLAFPRISSHPETNRSLADFLLSFGWTSFGSFVAVLMHNLGLQSEADVYRDLIIYTLAAIPTAFLARFLLDLPRTGRVGSMAWTTLGTSLALVGFGTVAWFASDPVYAAANHAALVGGTLGTSVAYNMLLQVCLTALWLVSFVGVGVVAVAVEQPTRLGSRDYLTISDKIF